jgi:anti-sigma regulatory factor (Ser/Thr protein kinase)
MPTPASTPAATRIDRSYPGAPEHVRAVRADLRALLDGCPIADDIVLCASELAANVALHSRSRLPGATFTVRAQVHPGSYACVEVQDNGGTWHDHAPRTDRSHGLDIIRALATAWGIDGDHTSRTAWARIDWPDRL